jgi:hypothetical protein
VRTEKGAAGGFKRGTRSWRRVVLIAGAGTAVGSGSLEPPRSD